MQDNAPVHTANVVKDWLREQPFEVMEWPPHSPDLNPIENLWALLKTKIYDIHPELHTMPDNDETLKHLVSYAQEAWSEIDLSVLENLAETMSNRVQEIIENDGWYTSY
ncbi:transposable element tc3 transposase [Penicillium angulare]|uniref:transposable element tc3 transposase n=1 Tax=Penicillium angulare TaxID=116970 RepID=UPI0025407565|nr:transposable element tc3 transposase [Penicillium angulare]KAJ5267693.1 transposable element tc3 transposase [Penicillium angulare]